MNNVDDHHVLLASDLLLMLREPIKENDNPFSSTGK